ncbi:MAG: acyl-CoA dehydrogenase [Dehalococcoidia bacterium]|nr:acyl-CoA dehydrogenase [Dehalococcoidia bacterium]
MADILLNEEELMLRSAVRAFAEKELAPRAEGLDATEHFSWENWKAIAKLGLFGIGLDARFGGSGGTAKQSALVVEELARACASTSVSYLVQVSLAAHPIDRFGNERQKAKWLPKLASGELVGAFGLTEPSGGSDAVAMQSTAVKKNGHYVLNGSKTFITNGSVADICLVFASLDRTQRHKGLVALVLEKGMRGYSTQKLSHKLGIRGSDTAALFFDSVEVPEENRLAEDNQGFTVMLETLNGSRINIAAQALGIAQASLDVSLKYAKERQAYGKPIADLQAIQFYLAEMGMRVEASRLMTYHAAMLRDAGKPFVKEASMAKAYTSESAVFCSDRAVQIHGGYGYLRGPAERYYRDARVTTIYEGTSEVQRVTIARQMLRESP